MNPKPIFEPFTWGAAELYDIEQPALLRMFADFLSKTRDIASGAASVSELLENDRRLVEVEQQPLLTPIQHESLARMATQALRWLDHDASEYLTSIERYLVPRKND